MTFSADKSELLTKNTCLKDQIIEMEESVFFHVNSLVLKAVANAEEKMKELLDDNLFRFSPLEKYLYLFYCQ